MDQGEGCEPEEGWEEGEVVDESELYPGRGGREVYFLVLGCTGFEKIVYVFADPV